jgi:hypothetical protein
MAEQSIIFGKGGLRFEDWRFVHRLILRYEVKTVLEYGCGLSTELLVCSGMKVTSLETQQKWAEPYLADRRFNVILCNYSDGYPDLKGRYDLGFIDGPGAAEISDRSKSVLHAKQRCNFLYMHDFNLNQFEQIDGDDKWVRCTAPGNHKSHFYALRSYLI